MKRILIGTRNEGKRRFLADLLADVPVRLVFLHEIGCAVDISETGTTPDENAEIKAVGYMQACQIPTLAIDSSLRIEGLPEKDQPGVQVRRSRSGDARTDAEVLDHYRCLVSALGGETKGLWRSAVALALPGGRIFRSAYQRHTILTSAATTQRAEGAPLNSMQMDPEARRYLADMAPEEIKLFYRRHMPFDWFVRSHLAYL